MPGVPDLHEMGQNCPGFEGFHELIWGFSYFYTGVPMSLFGCSHEFLEVPMSFEVSPELFSASKVPFASLFFQDLLPFCGT